MHLQGQAARRSTAVGQAGFALAAMLVAIAVLSVMLMVALPTWRHLAQREKEAELIFRGEQYGRAIALYQRKLAGGLPASIDMLVEQKFLRKKYKDPITGEDFVPVYANSQAGMAALQQGATPVADGTPRSGTAPGPGGQVTTTTPGRSGGQVRVEVTRGDGTVQTRSTFSSTGAGTGNGIVGVMSKSKAQSIRLYNGRDRYDQWIFTYMSGQPQSMMAPGQPGPRGAGPGTQSNPGFPQAPGRGRGGQ